MGQWYFQVADDVQGPVSWEELRQRAADGELQPSTSVRQGPDGPWMPAGEIAGLLEASASRVEDTASAGESEALEAAIPSLPQPGDEIRGSDHGVHRSPLALRPCSDCGTMVSQRASLCPHCGRSFLALSVDVPYGGEHPIPVMAFFAVLAIAFVLISPVVVYQLALGLTLGSTPDGAGSQTLRESDTTARWALLATAAYTVSMIVCAVLGGAVGAPRGAYLTGMLLGLFFGPLGVFVAFAIDKRRQCPNCFARLDGPARQCPACHVGLQWKMQRQWY